MVKFPDVEKMENFACPIYQCEPDVIGFMDGLALTSGCTLESVEQNAMYNGYHSDTMVNNIVMYDGPGGKVFLCALQVAGMMDQ
jgi:hypothetical protein